MCYENFFPIVIELKSVTLAFDLLVSKNYAFVNLTVLFVFRFDEGAIIEIPHFGQKAF
jgi:hypothetical protein